MNANELMLGDWVKYHGVPVRVVEISEKSVGFMSGGAYDIDKPENLMPIPLTPEILEKNGFSRNGLDIALFDRKGGDDFVGASNLQYVHELQHALRLCGIEKEIVL